MIRRGFLTRDGFVFRIGAVVTVVLLATGIALFYKGSIGTVLRPGETVHAEFARDYWLRPNVTKVKIAGVPIGVVTGVEPVQQDKIRAALKIDPGIREKLGKAPSAAIRPTTLFGGNYYVELLPGGDEGTASSDTIPLSRTTVPVELDRVLEEFPPSTRASTQRAIRDLDETFGRKGVEAARDLVDAAPDTLAPTGRLLQAVRGTRPEVDLAKVVSGLESTARQLTRRDDQLDNILQSLRDTTSVLATERRPLANTISTAPGTLKETRSTMGALDKTLVRLEKTSKAARPTARNLAGLLKRTDPVLRNARPLVRDVRSLLQDVRPAVERLVPTVRTATGVLDDVRGPVLDRVNGPIMRTVLSPYRGTGPYEGTGADRPFYQELAYMISGFGNASKLTDRNGAAVAIEPGISLGSVGGTPLNLERLLGNVGSGQGGADGN
ncbi:MlaD family protein [Haloechinothrix salitolerans]|uniref:MlaD family protein n=1 Tax=Haloechinothrix salitolerans TaxID=926830 RepID=A0ABW2C383_9PSEU